MLLFTLEVEIKISRFLQIFLSICINATPTCTQKVEWKKKNLFFSFLTSNI